MTTSCISLGSPQQWNTIGGSVGCALSQSQELIESYLKIGTDSLSQEAAVFLCELKHHILCLQVASEDSVAQKRFANAKSISSAQFFGNENQQTSRETEVRLQRFAVWPNNQNLYESLVRQPRSLIEAVNEGTRLSD